MKKKGDNSPLNQRNRVDSHWTCSLRSLFGVIHYDEDEGASPLTPNQSIRFPLNLLASLAIWCDPRNHNDEHEGGKPPSPPPLPQTLGKTRHHITNLLASLAWGCNFWKHHDEGEGASPLSLPYTEPSTALHSNREHQHKRRGVQQWGLACLSSLVIFFYSCLFS